MPSSLPNQRAAAVDADAATVPPIGQGPLTRRSVPAATLLSPDIPAPADTCDMQSGVNEKYPSHYGR